MFSPALAYRGRLAPAPCCCSKEKKDIASVNFIRHWYITETTLRHRQREINTARRGQLYIGYTPGTQQQYIGYTSVITTGYTGYNLKEYTRFMKTTYLTVTCANVGGSVAVQPLRIAQPDD